MLYLALHQVAQVLIERLPLLLCFLLQQDVCLRRDFNIKCHHMAFHPAVMPAAWGHTTFYSFSVCLIFYCLIP